MKGFYHEFYKYFTFNREMVHIQRSKYFSYTSHHTIIDKIHEDIH
jgi:hypothetical protein